MQNIIGVLVPLPQEAKALGRWHYPYQQVFQHNEQLLICRSGVGYANAKEAAMKLIASGANQLISFGTAAALTSGLAVGNIVIPEIVVDTLGHRYLSQHPFRADCIKFFSQKKDLVIHEGILSHASDVLRTSEHKKNLAKQTTAIAADMESFALAEIASENEIPFTVIRVISDEVDFQLPDIIISALSSAGHFNYAKFFLGLVQKPAEIVGCYELMLKFNKAKKTMVILGAWMLSKFAHIL